MSAKRKGGQRWRYSQNHGFCRLISPSAYFCRAAGKAASRWLPRRFIIYRFLCPAGTFPAGGKEKTEKNNLRKSECVTGPHSFAVVLVGCYQDFGSAGAASATLRLMLATHARRWGDLERESSMAITRGRRFGPFFGKEKKFIEGGPGRAERNPW